MLLDTGAEKLRKSKQALRALLDSLPEMELVMIRPQDRVLWSGSDDLVVFGTTQSKAEIATDGTLHGYTPTGEPVELGVFEVPRYAVLVLQPREIDFGLNPEAQRASAPNRTRLTISTREVEFSLDPARQDPECTASACAQISAPAGQISLADGFVTPTEICAPGQSPPGCTEPPPPPDDPDPPPPPSGGFDLGVSYSYCTSPVGDDADADGVRDGCEESIAQAFTPVLRIQSNDRCQEREPYWSATRWAGDRPFSLKVMYMLSYHKDCGSPTLIGPTSHDGDSEFIIVTVEANHASAPTRWYTYSVTTSAHFGAFTDATRTWHYTDWPDWYWFVWRGKPVVWVALDKHANYRSQSACDSGAYGYDTCSGPFFTDSSSVLGHAAANVGNNWSTPTAARLKHLVYSRSLTVTAGEYIWGSIGQRQDPTDHPYRYFCGWVSNGPDCAGGYGRPVNLYRF